MARHFGWLDFYGCVHCRFVSISFRFIICKGIVKLLLKSKLFQREWEHRLLDIINDKKRSIAKMDPLVSATAQTLLAQVLADKNATAQAMAKA